MNAARITDEVARAGHAQPATTSRPLPRRDGMSGLVEGAAAGEERAWALLVGRFDATIHGVARRYRLSRVDQDDVAQRTWLALVVHIGNIRESEALGGWLTTTAQRECLRLIESRRREIPVEEPIVADQADGGSVEDEVAVGERRDALRGALDRAPAHERRLVRLLLDEPALSYEEVSAVLGIAKGSIGPTRGRCLERLRGDRRLAGVVGSSVPPRPARRRPASGHERA